MEFKMTRAHYLFLLLMLLLVGIGAFDTKSQEPVTTKVMVVYKETVIHKKLPVYKDRVIIIREKAEEKAIPDFSDQNPKRNAGTQG